MAEIDSSSTPSKLRYLLVDDHAGFRDMVKSFLPQGAVHVHECANGEEALKECQSWHPDWIVMDIEMPVMNGFEATREIMRRDPRAKVVVITQYDAPGFREKAIRCGAMGFLSKENLEGLEPLLRRLDQDANPHLPS